MRLGSRTGLFKSLLSSQARSSWMSSTPPAVDLALFALVMDPSSLKITVVYIKQLKLCFLFIDKPKLQFRPLSSFSLKPGSADGNTGAGFSLGTLAGSDGGNKQCSGAGTQPLER